MPRGVTHDPQNASSAGRATTWRADDPGRTHQPGPGQLAGDRYGRDTAARPPAEPLPPDCDAARGKETRRHRMHPIRPEELLLAVFAGGLAVLAVVARVVPRWLSTLASDLSIALVGVAVVVASLVALRRLRPARHQRAVRVLLGTLRAFLPLVACVLCYSTLRDLTPALGFPLHDQQLAAIDRVVLRVDASRWLDDHLGSPGMTLFTTLCYLSYGSAQAAWAINRYLGGHVRAYRDFSLAISLTGVLGYSGYVLVPGVGPHIWQASRYADRLPGEHGLVGRLLEAINDFQGPARDVFPSLHTGMTVVLLFYLWRDGRTLFWCYLPVACGLILSTVYLRKHYVVDVVAGLAVAGMAIALAGPINRWWYSAAA